MDSAGTTELQDGSITHEKLAPRLLMAAYIRRDGTVVAGTPDITSERKGEGQYDVTLPASNLTCNVVGQTNTIAGLSGTWSRGSTISVTNDEQNVRRIHAVDSAGNLADRTFSIIVVCT